MNHREKEHRGSFYEMRGCSNDDDEFECEGRSSKYEYLSREKFTKE